MPFESYEAVKRLISECVPGVVWDDGAQIGILENDVGRFEFHCDEELLALGVLSVNTSHRQNVAQSHRLLSALHRKGGLAVLDEQTMEFID
jgi:hypothetical protein